MANDDPQSREGRANAPTERSGGFERGDVEATLPTRDLDGEAADELDEERDAALLRAIAYAPPRRPPSAVAPGSTWGEGGRYIIEKRLGRGGMGTVYAATDIKLKRLVALKVLDVADPDPAHHARLVREAQTAAQVEHERIARVYDVGSHDGFPFVAMEYVMGGTLRQWMTRGEHPLAQIVDVATQIAEGLAELHAAAVVHRDLKPENVMRNAQGGIKLVDFGLARHALQPALHSEAGVPIGARRNLATDNTSTAASSGTPGYMAPEQCTGKPIDARADIFALGVILYELIAQAKPFRGSTVGAIVDATLEGVPVPSDGAWAKVPAALRAHVARMLRPAPEERFPDGAAAVAALREVVPLLAAPRGRISGGIAQTVGRAATERPARLRAPAFAEIGMATRGLELPVALSALVVLLLMAFAPSKPTASSAPPGMALIDVGTIDVGRTPFELEAECKAMGADCDREYLYRETPRVRVTVPPFYIDRDEVTNAELAVWLNQYIGSVAVFDDQDEHYPRFVRLNDSFGGYVLYDLYPMFADIEYVSLENTHAFRVRDGRAQYPAAQVTWHAARLFCAAHNKRLPSDTEWEAAARGSSDRRFPWGDDLPRCGEVAIAGDQWIPGTPPCSATDLAQPVGVMVQDVTPEGVRDLGGNASEWTSSPYFSFRRRVAVTDSSPRVIRGGSWTGSLMVRTSARDAMLPAHMRRNVGFRCASNIDDARP